MAGPAGAYDTMFEIIEEHGKSTTLAPRTTVYIVIPAETEGIDSDKLTKRGQSQLNEIIRSRVISTISRVYSSPKKSALKTAGALRREFEVPVQVEDDLTELSLGRPSSQEELGQVLRSLWEDHDFAPRGGESIHQATERISECMNRIVSQHQADSIAVVTHPLVAILFVRLVSGGIPLMEEWLSVGHASCGAFEHQRRSWTMIMPLDNSFLTSPSTVEDSLPEEAKRVLIG
ncbi:MAG: hypothetical protein DRO73_06045 [Candidatus Thorarchaeota archaeon]|nr:MAG: hypothetical protein DRO73_06045 [Candidatus Thorarchaeota archaeon]